MTKYTKHEFSHGDKLEKLRSAVPVTKIEDVEEESEREETSPTGSKLIDEESSDETEVTSIMNVSKIRKLKVVRGLNKSKTAYQLKDDGYTNIEA